MTKHIAGLIMFSFIVGTSVFISALTIAERSVDVTVYEVSVAKKKKRKRKKRRCRRHHSRADVSLETAVFNRTEGELFASFRNSSYPASHEAVELHFFSKDRNGVRFLKTESFGYIGRNLEQSRRMDWLTRLDENQNVYVLAKINNEPTSWSTEPRFDASEAVPLMVVVE